MAEEQDNKVAKKQSTDVTKWDQPLNLGRLSVTQMRFIGQAMADSGMFPDIQKDSAKAMVKILAGQEIGVTPFQAMSNINIIQGKAAMGANLMAAKVKGSGKYDYRAEISNEKCTVTIRQIEPSKTTFEDIGSYTFSMEDARRIGLANKDNWRNYPQNMLFARAISNAVRMYAPDVFNGNLVYDPDELGARTDDMGNVEPGSDEGDQLDEAVKAIQEAETEDELTDIVTKLPADLQKQVVTVASERFKELQGDSTAVS